MKKSFGPKILTTPAPAWVVGSYSHENKPNFMCIAWGGICCSEPPCLTISLRKATATYGFIMQKKAFTVNVPGEDQAAITDFVGLVSGKDVDKCREARITAVRGDLVDAPILQEFPVSIELKLVHTIDLGLHTQFVGQIMDVKAEEGILSDGRIDPLKLRPILFDPLSSQYFALGRVVGKGFSLGRQLS